MIRSFADHDTAAFFAGQRVKAFEPFAAVARRKLQQLDSAATLEFLKSPPGNRLEALKGDRKGSYSIRINDQYRLCFRWDDGAHDVIIIDYH